MYASSNWQSQESDPDCRLERSKGWEPEDSGRDNDETVNEDIINQQRSTIVWQCAKPNNENIRPAGRQPKEGCLSWNIMSATLNADGELTKRFQTSPCKKCGKRIRSKGNIHVFESKEEALEFLLAMRDING